MGNKRRSNRRANAKGRTEGEAELYHGVPIPVGTHMGALFDAGLAAGLVPEHQTW